MASQKQQITAIIYSKRGKVLAIGKNSYIKTHPIQARYAERVGLPEKIFLHAEIAALIKCTDLRKAHRITIFRTLKDGTLALAKPCPVCASAIAESGIKIVEHS